MKNLPSTSHTSMVNGIWFVHREPEVILRVWLSTLNGKEKVYANEELVAEKRNVTRLTTLHQFDYLGADYDLEIYASNVMLMELECNIFREGKLISALVNSYQLRGGMGTYEILENDNRDIIIQRALDRYQQGGIRELNEYDLSSARQFFQKALAIEGNHPEPYFLMACIASLEEDAERGFGLLEKALSFGLTGQDRILKEDKLAYLRVQPGFDSFYKKHFGDKEG